MLGVRKKSKVYNENPNRRVQISDWRFYSNIIDLIDDGANQNEVTRSRFFEAVIKNHFL